MYCRSTKIKNHLRIRHKIEQIESETLSSLLVQVRKKGQKNMFILCVKELHSYSRILISTHILVVNGYLGALIF